MDDRVMPAVFVGHGSPMDAIGVSPARTGWKQMVMHIEKPKAIVAISAHWLTKGLHVRVAEENTQIYDIYGFPDELYKIKYAPKSDIDIANKVLSLLGDTATPLNDWGIDHGIWSVLSNMYPEADIPVILVSVNANGSPQEQFEVGKRLSSLRKEGIMILGSGDVVHNLRMVDWDLAKGHKWADQFDKQIKEAILKGDFKTPIEFDKLQDWRLSVATGEHYYPLLSVLGAASMDEKDSNMTGKVSVWNDFRELGSISMTSYIFE